MVNPRRWSMLAFVCAAATGLALAFAPLVATSSCVASSNGPAVCSSAHHSLVTNEGVSVVLVLAIPALLMLVPVVFGSRRSVTTAAVLLTMTALLAIASIGLFFIPTVALAWVAATRWSRPRPAPTTG